MSSILETLALRKAQACREWIAEGNAPETFPQFWEQIEHLELATIAGQPDLSKPIASMTIQEKTALRESVGDNAFAARCIRESKK